MPTDNNNALSFPTTDSSDIAALKKVGGFLPNLRVADFMTPFVKKQVLPVLSFYLSDESEDKIITVGVVDTDVDGIKKGMFVGVPLSIRPHALYLKDNKSEIETFDVNSDEWRQINDMYKSKPKTPGAMVGIDVLYWVSPEQLNYSLVKDAKFKKDSQERYKNGVICVLYYKNNSRQFTPDYALPKAGNKLTELRVKSKIASWETYTWARPEEHVIVRENCNPSDVFKSAVDVNAASNGAITSITSFRSPPKQVVINAEDRNLTR